MKSRDLSIEITVISEANGKAKANEVQFLEKASVGRGGGGLPVAFHDLVACGWCPHKKQCGAERATEVRGSDSQAEAAAHRILYLWQTAARGTLKIVQEKMETLLFSINGVEKKEKKKKKLSSV